MGNAFCWDCFLLICFSSGTESDVSWHGPPAHLAYRRSPLTQQQSASCLSVCLNIKQIKPLWCSFQSVLVSKLSSIVLSRAAKLLYVFPLLSPQYIIKQCFKGFKTLYCFKRHLIVYQQDPLRVSCVTGMSWSVLFSIWCGPWGLTRPGLHVRVFLLPARTEGHSFLSVWVPGMSF